jgi:holin-like protein
MIASKMMNELASLLHFPVPGSILGMLIVFALLQAGVIRLEWIDAGAKWLLAEMLLFFIPAAVGVLPYKGLLLGNGLQIAAVILCSTLIVMACAGAVAQGLAKIKERKSS